MPKKQTKNSFIDIMLNRMQDLFAPEDIAKRGKEKSEYYTNPFGGFLP